MSVILKELIDVPLVVTLSYRSLALKEAPPIFLLSMLQWLPVILNWRQSRHIFQVWLICCSFQDFRKAFIWRISCHLLALKHSMFTLARKILYCNEFFSINQSLINLHSGLIIQLTFAFVQFEFSYSRNFCLKELLSNIMRVSLQMNSNVGDLVLWKV